MTTRPTTIWISNDEAETLCAPVRDPPEAA